MHITIVGCGQLARMIALSGWRLGFTFSFLSTPGENILCVKGLGDIVELTSDIEGEALFNALGKPHVVTVEKENINTDVLKKLQPFCAVYPKPNAIEISQHRGREKAFLNEIGVATTPYKVTNSKDSLAEATDKMTFPFLVKSCEEGYDGHGQWKIENSQQRDEFLLSEHTSSELVVENFVAFDQEVSLIAARTPDGRCALYPVTENQHSNGILVSSIAPAELISPHLFLKAKQCSLKILDALEYVGVLSVEFFVIGEQLLVNEIAPRVHNSGHWTQAAGICSQFENHLRSITSKPLGDSKPSTYAGMINLLGHQVSSDVLNKGNVELHQYNKSIRPNRKVGHINLWDIDRQRLVRQISDIKQELISGAPYKS